MTDAKRLAEAKRRVAGLRAVLREGRSEIVGLPRELIEQDLKLLGLPSLAALFGARDQPSVTRHEPPPNTNRRNVPMRQHTALQTVPVSPQVMQSGGGFASMAEFLLVVRQAAKGTRDPRLAAAATVVTKGGVGTDGGFAIPTPYGEQIGNAVRAQQSLLTLCDVVFTERNAIDYPVDETTQWSTGGIKAHWIGEGQPIQQTKVELRNVHSKLSKLEALVPITEELSSDALAVAQYVQRKAPEAIYGEVNSAIMRGTGAGMPLGILNSGALVTVDKEVSQAADSIVGANVGKMLARLPASSFPNAVWLIHPDAVPQLPGMTLNDASIFTQAANMPSGAIGLLLGRPVIPHQVCSTVGDVGDIVLADFTQYLAAVKIGGLKFQVSIHIWFDLDVAAYKFGLRILGQPLLSAPIAPRVGTMKQSPFVALAARD